MIFFRIITMIIYNLTKSFYDYRSITLWAINQVENLEVILEVQRKKIQ